jgi:DNA-binding response OmpR family regulator
LNWWKYGAVTSSKPDSKKILIIDDDQELNALLTDYLSQFDFDVISADHPTRGLELLKEERPALVILDVMLPDSNGFEICKQIRRDSSVPIIMLTARGDLSDRVTGFELGADDYVPKPYEPRELVARIQSVLRRASHAETIETHEFLYSQDLKLDLKRERALLTGEPLDLTQTEFEILKFLMRHPSVTLSRDQIMDHLRGTKCNAFERTVDVLVSRLRQKLGDSAKQPKYLKTSWGSGYRFIGTVRESQEG